MSHKPSFELQVEIQSTRVHCVPGQPLRTEGEACVSTPCLPTLADHPARAPWLQEPAGGAGETASLPAIGSLGGFHFGRSASLGASPDRNKGRTQFMRQG